MSSKIFRQIMDNLTINYGEFEFIDFGSGKGRVLILASEYGFKKVVGVEFAKELHDIATNNVRIYELITKKTTNIETICEDAVRFPIPSGQVVIFFYSPFTGKVMEQVVNNISQSFVMNPIKVILVFYGGNPESIEMLKATNFNCRELVLRPVWSQFLQYRGLVFVSPGNT